MGGHGSLVSPIRATGFVWIPPPTSCYSRETHHCAGSTQGTVCSPQLVESHCLQQDQIVASAREDSARDSPLNPGS